MQTISNIDAYDTWKIYTAYYRQEFKLIDFSFQFGLYDLNSEFDVIERSGLFINSSFGIGPDYSQSGENGPSIFPTTSLAFKVEKGIGENIVARAAILDGVAGDPMNQNGTRIILDADDGFLISGELNYIADSENNGKFGLGGWMYTKPTALIDPAEKATSSNAGIYLFGEYPLTIDSDSERAFGIFGRIGYADPKINQVEYYIGGGLTFDQILSRSFPNTIGIAIAAAMNGREFKDAVKTEDKSINGGEAMIELTGQFGVYGSVSIQPDIQYIFNPGADSNVDDAFVIGLRLGIEI